MPRGDGTGPRGMGQMTGRAAGYCAGVELPGYANPNVGGRAGSGARHGQRSGRGGRGWRNMFYATGQPGWFRSSNAAFLMDGADPFAEKRTLKQQAEALQMQLNEIKNRLTAIETDSE